MNKFIFLFQIDKSDCYFYDPKLYKEEKEFLRSSGFTVIVENEVSMVNN